MLVLCLFLLKLIGFQIVVYNWAVQILMWSLLKAPIRVVATTPSKVLALETCILTLYLTANKMVTGPK